MRIKSVFEGTNAELLAYIAPLWIRDDDVLDVTVGEFKWWTEWRPTQFSFHDQELDGVDFCNLPEDDQSVGVVAFDPPYISTGSVDASTLQRRNSRDHAPDFYLRYGLGKLKGYKAVFAVNSLGLAECARVVRPGGRVLCKCSDFVESGKLHLGFDAMLHAGEAAGLRLADYVVHYSGTGPQPLTNPDGSSRIQKTTHRAHSFLQIFVKPGRTKKK